LKNILVALALFVATISPALAAPVDAIKVGQSGLGVAVEVLHVGPVAVAPYVTENKKNVLGGAAVLVNVNHIGIGVGSTFVKNKFTRLETALTLKF